MAEAKALELGQKWLNEKGWSPEQYHVAISVSQSCPSGLFSVDITRLPAKGDESPMDEKELLRQSRVLEVNTDSGVIENVLAARDPQQLDIERTKVRTQVMREGIAASALADSTEDYDALNTSTADDSLLLEDGGDGSEADLQARIQEQANSYKSYQQRLQEANQAAQTLIARTEELEQQLRLAVLSDD